MKSKILIFLSFVFLILKTSAQVSVYSLNSSVQVNVNNTQLNSSAPINGTTILIEDDQFNSSINPISKEVLACEQIKMLPNTKLQIDFGQSIQLKIANNQLDVFSYSHEEIDDIPYFEKFETGIVIPPAIENKINMFLAAGDTINGLNPFLAWDINLVAHYKHLQSGYEDYNFGFFTEDYQRNTSSPNADNWYWMKLPTLHRFRVRYSFPEKTGEWSVNYELYVNGSLLHSYCPFIVNITEGNNNHDYVKVGENKKVLTKNGELFFPVGQNLKWPDFFTCDYRPDGKPCGVKPYLYFDSLLEAYKNSGNDFFRILQDPGSWDIEFEKIGDYSDRLNYAMELDKVVDFATVNNMNIDWNMLLQYQFMTGNPYALHSWDWSGDSVFGFGNASKQQSCYASQLNVANGYLFLSNEECKKYHKQKIKYIISRYGYSSAIALFELASEINAFGFKYDTTYPSGVYDYNTAIYVFDTTSDYYNQNPSIVENWHNEMSTYIKEGLGHTEHLISTDYASIPNDNDHSFGLPNIDIIGYNDYQLNSLFFSKLISERAQNYWNTYQKPVFLHETGELGLFYCDSGLTQKQFLWQLPFLGIAGFNLWEGNRVEYAKQWQDMKDLHNWLYQSPDIVDAYLHNWVPIHIHSEKSGDDNNDVNATHKNDVYMINKLPNSGGSEIYYSFGAYQNLTNNGLSNNLLSASSAASSCYIGSSIYNLGDNGTSSEPGFIGTKQNINYLEAIIINPFSISPMVVEVEYDYYQSDLTNHYTPITLFNPLFFYHPYSCVNSCLSLEAQAILPFEAFISEVSVEKSAFIDETITNDLKNITEFKLISVYNIMGQEVLSKSNNPKHFLDGLSPGVYFVVYLNKNTNEYFTKKWQKS